MVLPKNSGQLTVNNESGLIKNCTDNDHSNKSPETSGQRLNNLSDNESSPIKTSVQITHNNNNNGSINNDEESIDTSPVVSFPCRRIYPTPFLDH